MLRAAKIFYWFVLAALSFAVSAAAMPMPTPQPFTPQLRQQIDALAQAERAKQHLAGFSLAIAKDGNIIYTQGYGYRNLAKRLAATPETIYNIGSITKQFTATCVMLLQQDGKLNVDDKLAKYLPQFPWSKEVTIRELLNHTSGVPDYLEIVDNNSLTIPKIVAALEKTKLQFPPGSKYQYSNSNYIVAGVLVSKVSGMPFDTFLTTRIIKPLGLKSTSIGTTPLDMPNGATGYTVVKGKTVAVNPHADSVAILDYPDGGVNTTVLDLVKWDVALDTGRVVSMQTFKLMVTSSPHRTDWPYGYGFGLGLDRVNGHREVVHEGEWTGFAGENATFPDDGFDIVMLANTDGFAEDDLKRKIFRLFYPAQL